MQLRGRLCYLMQVICNGAHGLINQSSLDCEGNQCLLPTVVYITRFKEFHSKNDYKDYTMVKLTMQTIFTESPSSISIFKTSLVESSGVDQRRIITAFSKAFISQSHILF